MSAPQATVGMTSGERTSAQENLCDAGHPACEEPRVSAGTPLGALTFLHTPRSLPFPSAPYAPRTAFSMETTGMTASSVTT